MCQQWQFLVKSTAKTTNFSTKFELKVFKEPDYYFPKMGIKIAYKMKIIH